MTCDTDSDLASACGIYCGDCEFHKEICPGCPVVAGKVFWTEIEGVEHDSCPIYECCVIEKGLEHCGLCPDLPCEVYMDLVDPNDPVADVHKQVNIRELRRRKEIGTCAWLVEKRAKRTDPEVTS